MVAVLVNDNDEVRGLFASLRDNEPSVTWIAMSADDQADGSLGVSVLGHGSGGVEAYRAHHLHSGAVVYVAMAVAQLQGPHAVFKHVLVTWVGPDCAPLARARSSVARGRVYELVDRLVLLHGELQALDAAELSDTLVAQKLAGSKLEAAVAEESTQRPKQAGSGGAPRPFTWRDESDVRGGVEAMRRRDVNWLLLGYADGDDGPVSVLGRGAGGLGDVAPLLDDGRVAYFVLGVQPENERTHGGDFTQTKHMLVTWVGRDVEPLHKARSSQHRLDIYNWVKQIMQLHGEYQVLDPKELTEQLLKEKLTLSKVRDEDDLLRAAELDRQKKLALEQKRRQPQHNFSGFVGSPSGVSAAPSTRSSPSPSPSSSSSPAPSPFRGDAEQQAVAAIRQLGSGADSNWIVFVYEANKVNVTVAASGHGGLDDFVPGYFTAGTVAYALYGLAVDEGDYSTIKYVLITYVDPDVPALHKARSSQHRVALYNFVNQYVQLAGEFHCLDRHISRELLLQKLAGSSIVNVGDDASARKAALSTRATRGASFSRLPDSSSSSSSSSPGGYTFVDEPAIVELLRQIQKPDSVVDYVLFNHPDGPARNTIGVAASGSSGAAELPRLFLDDQIAYAVLVYPFVEHDDASGNYGTKKNLFISWVGENVPPLSKARSSQHRVALERWIKLHLQLHGTLHAISRAELTDDMFKERLKK